MKMNWWEKLTEMHEDAKTNHATVDRVTVSKEKLMALACMESVIGFVRSELAPYAKAEGKLK